MICPACGARNGATAPWCTQCFVPLAPGGAAADPTAASSAGPTAPGPVPAPASPEGTAETSAPAGGAAGGPGVPAERRAASDSVAGSSSRDIRQGADGGIEWRCAACDGWSPLEAATCLTCGGPRRGFGATVEEQAPPADAERLVGVSLLLPGLGHVMAGRAGSGLARAVFAVGWLVGGVALLVAGIRAGTASLSSVPLLAGAGAVWVLTAADARSLARGERRERLDGRTLLWLMAGVTGALVVLLLFDAWRLAG